MEVLDVAPLAWVIDKAHLKDPRKGYTKRLRFCVHHLWVHSRRVQISHLNLQFLFGVVGHAWIHLMKMIILDFWHGLRLLFVGEIFIRSLMTTTRQSIQLWRWVIMMLATRCGGTNCKIGEPLKSTHVDSFFFYFRKYLATRPPHPFTATTTDCFFFSKLVTLYKRNKEEIFTNKALLRYPTGGQLLFGVSWDTVDHVFIPIFMSRGHWILGVFDLRNWKLELFNSYMKHFKDEEVMEEVKPLREMLPLVVSKMAVFHVPYPHLLVPCSINKNVPQQQNGGDCGILTMKFAEYIAEGNIDMMPNLFDTRAARWNLAVQLYKISTR